MLTQIFILEGPEFQETAYRMLGDISMLMNLVLLIFCHICAGSIRLSQVLSVFITCYISSKVKAFNTAWVTMKLMNFSAIGGISCWSSNGCIEI